mmetsp:Transcript_19530/g.48735  ORF Transcript_19530/g.48735 Transcript_19530/m.48735 type:complete len:85 (+) Transcript_19530:445-699(+)
MVAMGVIEEGQVGRGDFERFINSLLQCAIHLQFILLLSIPPDSIYIFLCPGEETRLLLSMLGSRQIIGCFAPTLNFSPRRSSRR